MGGQIDGRAGPRCIRAPKREVDHGCPASSASDWCDLHCIVGKAHETLHWHLVMLRDNSARNTLTLNLKWLVSDRASVNSYVVQIMLNSSKLRSRITWALNRVMKNPISWVVFYYLGSCLTGFLFSLTDNHLTNQIQDCIAAILH